MSGAGPVMTSSMLLPGAIDQQEFNKMVLVIALALFFSFASLESPSCSLHRCSARARVSLSPDCRPFAAAAAPAESRYLHPAAMLFRDASVEADKSGSLFQGCRGRCVRPEEEGRSHQYQGSASHPLLVEPSSSSFGVVVWCLELCGFTVEDQMVSR